MTICFGPTHQTVIDVNSHTWQVMCQLIHHLLKISRSRGYSERKPLLQEYLPVCAQGEFFLRGWGQLDLVVRICQVNFAEIMTSTKPSYQILWFRNRVSVCLQLRVHRHRVVTTDTYLGLRLPLKSFLSYRYEGILKSSASNAIIYRDFNLESSSLASILSNALPTCVQNCICV